MFWGPWVFQVLNSVAGDGGGALQDVVVLSDVFYFDNNVVYPGKLDSVGLLVLTLSWCGAGQCDSVHSIPDPFNK